MRKLYLECNMGISGDMFVAAMLDLGADENVLKQVLATIPVSGFEIRISRVKRMGLSACDFDVIVDDGYENHDHDMDYLYRNLDGTQEGYSHDEHGREQSQDAHEHGHSQDAHGREQSQDAHEHGHSQDAHGHGHSQDAHGQEYSQDAHGHGHSQDAHGQEYSQDAHGHGYSQDTHGKEHHHAHRGLAEVMQIIDATQMSEGARLLAKRIFTILGEAEAAAHGTVLEAVHFHEVGAVDSIVDIIAAAVCVDNLGITETIVPVLYEGSGRIRCQHGVLPVPVPAVANIVAKTGLKLHITDRQGELVTPTGAAIAAAICTERKLPEEFHIIRIGIGAGKRNYDSPSVVRAMLIDGETDAEGQDVIYKLESNIDDCTGENLGYVMDELLAAGAKDVHYTPVFMKKGRPAYQLNVICRKEDIQRLEQIIFYETTTIGIRRVEMMRSVLPREIRVIETELGEARVKVCSTISPASGDEIKKFYPEYESATALARQTGRPFSEIYDIVANAAEEM